MAKETFIYFMKFFKWVKRKLAFTIRCYKQLFLMEFSTVDRAAGNLFFRMSKLRENVQNSFLIADLKK